MDLSFARLDRDVLANAMPIGLAILLVGAAARQAASPTARAQARLDMAKPADALLSPSDGAFSCVTAKELKRWQHL